MKETINDVLVLKVGTSTLVERGRDGAERLDRESFQRIGAQVLELQDQGVHVAIVSSGAITAGMVETGLRQRPSSHTDASKLQRLASIGWRHVLNAWSIALAPRTIGELLLTQAELSLPSERGEALAVTHELFANGNIPIINENDTITHQEIGFGDNDVLAAIFAARLSRSPLFNAVRLMLLSDIDGVYADIEDCNSVVRTFDAASDFRGIPIGSAGVNGTGGIASKLQAAAIARRAGISTWLTHGRTEGVVRRTLEGQIGTHFAAFAAADSAAGLFLPQK